MNTTYTDFNPARLVYNNNGLIPVVVQHYKTKQVLMMAWMNQQAVTQTLSTGFVTYWSRSRQAMWVKGETSGHWQQLVAMHTDCDADCLLVLVDQTGAACHTGQESCFYRILPFKKT